MKSRQKICAKWLYIVIINGAFGLAVSMPNSETLFKLGIVSGMFTWWIAYSVLDNYLIYNGYMKQSDRLTTCALIRAPLQFLIVPDTIAGLFADETISIFGLRGVGGQYLEAYLLTVFTGLYLSIICLVIYMILAGIAGIKDARRNS